MGPASLSPEELESLHALTLGSVRRRINSAHAAKLAALGLARETADGYVITARGRAWLQSPPARPMSRSSIRARPG